jgi:HprK-related kinase A
MIGVQPRQVPDRRFAFRIGGTDIAVRSDLPEVIDDLAVLYRGCARDAATGEDAISMEVKQAPHFLPARRRYAVFGDGEAFGEEVRRREVLPYLEWGVNWRVIARCTGSLLVHAASMGRDGRGVVFAGPSGAGKSTLVAGLLARGWQYLCDEFAMIDARTLKLLPFPKAVCVKAGAFDLIRRLNLPLCGERRYVKALKGNVGYISPSDLPAGAAGRPCPVRFVIFPRYTGHPEPRARPLSDAKAAFVLTSHTLNRAALGARAASTASRIARDARCYILDTGDIGGACDLIESLVSRPSA